MKVVATERFRDLKEGIIREIGDEFDISKKRFKEIIEKGGAWIKEIQSGKSDEEVEA